MNLPQGKGIREPLPDARESELEFLKALFSENPQGQILIWTKDPVPGHGKTSYWGANPAEVLGRVPTRYLRDRDVYYGIGLSASNRGPHHRCKAEEIIGIGGLLIDFDVAGPGHNESTGKVYPPTFEAIDQILRQGTLPPSFVVCSGGGLQPCWLFDRMWYFKDAEDRARAAALSLRLQEHYRGIMQVNGWVLDRTHDLARVMRLPGTFNHKIKGNPRAVELRPFEALRRYSVPEIIESLPASTPACSDIFSLSCRTATGEPRAAAFTLRADAIPPGELFDDMMSAHPKFRATWERNRLDFQDQSPSAYDMSLAVLAASAGWADQDIVNLLIAWRRKHGIDEKLREDYYILTLRKARDMASEIEERRSIRREGDIPEQERGEWPDLIPFDDSNLPEFPLDTLPAIPRAMVEGIAKAGHVDYGMAGSMVLASLSAAVNGWAVVDLRSHKEPCNLYIACVADVGQRKSYVTEKATRPIYDFQAKIQEEQRPNVVAAEVREEVRKSRYKALQAKAAKVDGDERRILINQLETLRAEMEADPVPADPVLIADDVTYEALGVLLQQQGERIAIISAEGGIFSGIDGQYNKKDPNIDLWLKGHTGEPYSVYRVGRPPVTLMKPTLSIGLCIQPRVIEEIGKNARFEGRGLLARFIYNVPPSRVGFREYLDIVLDPKVERKYSGLLWELLEYREPVKPMPINGEAKEVWIEYHDKKERAMLPEGSMAQIKEFGSKQAGTAARLAGLLHLAEYGAIGFKVDISAETVRAACRLADYYSAHSKAVLGLMKEDPAFAVARKILNWLKRTGSTTFTGRDVLRGNFFKNRNMGEIQPGLNLLIERSYIRPLQRPTTHTAGRPPAVEYEVRSDLSR